MDRSYLSRYGTVAFGIQVYQAGVLADADGVVTAVVVTDDGTGTPATTVFTPAVTNSAPGEYTVQLNGPATATPGPFQLVWSYSVGAVPQTYAVPLEVGQSAPAYDFLVDVMKTIIESVWVRFADGFDSLDGGPNLQEYFQATWSRNRVAQLMRIACGKLNTLAQPTMTYTIDGDGGASFPTERWGPLLEQATYVECLRHLVRSYTEQPEFSSGAGISRLDRRDYMDRWQNILAGEEPILKAQLDHFKIRHMGFGAPRVLVSGGVFGRYGPARFPMSAAARPRMSTMFY